MSIDEAERELNRGLRRLIGVSALLVAGLIALAALIPESWDGLGPSAPAYRVTALGPDLRPVRSWTTRKRPRKVSETATSPTFGVNAANGQPVMGFASTDIPTGEIRFTDAATGEEFTLPRPWKVEPLLATPGAE